MGIKYPNLMYYEDNFSRPFFFKIWGLFLALLSTVVGNKLSPKMG